MAKSTLRASEYEKILKFEYQVSQERDFHGSALKLLNELFGWNLTAYTKWSKQNQIISYVTNGFDEEFIYQNHNSFSIDMLYEAFNEQMLSNSWNGIFYLQEMDQAQLTSARHMDFLHRYHIHYFAIMLINTDPREHYTSFHKRYFCSI